MRKGTAGEYLVCADLLLKGYSAVLSVACEPYDILVDYGDSIKRIQVKSANKKKNSSSYKFTLNSGRGGGGSHAKRVKLDLTQFDILALVTLDTKKVYYIPFDLIKNSDGRVKGTVSIKESIFA